MSQKLKRGGSSARRQAAKASSARKVAAARAHTGSAMDRILAVLPFSEAQLHRFFLIAILGSAIGLAWLVAVLAGVPAMASQQVSTIASQAGFEVHRVEVHGVKHLNEMKVYERVLAQQNRAMPMVDLAAVREELLQLSWVEDARVSRQLPDTLVVDIVERTPGPVLREGDHLTLIDASGHKLEPISAARVRGRMILSGEGVADKVGDLTALLDAAPALRPQVAEAEWVGHRRWNLTFKTHQVLALPEGDKVSADALVSFARLDGTNRLLGGRVVAFDMRTPDRIYMRVPGSSTEGLAAAPLTAVEATSAPVGDATSAPEPASLHAPVSGTTVAAVAAGAAAVGAVAAAHKDKAAKAPSHPAAVVAKSAAHGEKAKAAAKPVTKSAIKPAGKSATKPVAKPVAKPAAKSASHAHDAADTARRNATIHNAVAKVVSHQAAHKAPEHKPAAKKPATQHSVTQHKDHH